MNLTKLLEETLKKGIFEKYQLLIKHQENWNAQEYYEPTPIFDIHTKLKTDNFIVLIPFHKPIDIGRNWKYCNINTIVVATREELLKIYSGSQLNRWLEWLDKEVRREVIIKCL